MSHPHTLLALLLVASHACAWDIRDEGYTCGTGGMSLAELQSAGITLVSHVPCTPEWMAEAARYGIRGMPYISLYKVYDIKAPGANPNHPFWGAVAMNDHPEWVYIRADGQRARPFNNPFYPKVNWQSCTNTAGIADAYCRGAAGVMRTGAGGVFIDNVLPSRICYGPKFGIHTHLYPDKDNIHSFKIALRRVHDTVKSFGPRSVVMLNVGQWELWKGFGDCIMLESFIYNVKVRPGPGGWVGKQRVRVKQWPQIRKWIDDTASCVDGGGSIVTLEYLPREPEAAFTTYACAKLANFLWSGSMTVRRDVIRTLHRCRLQRAAGPLRQAEGVYFRHYPEGLAAVNPTDNEVTVHVPSPPGCAELADVRHNRRVAVRDGRVRLSIPPDSGRVYVTPQRLADGHLRETLVALHTAAEAHAGPPDTRLRRAIEATQAARKAITRHGSLDPAVSPLAALCRALAACGQADGAQGLSTRLAKGEKLSRDDVLRLLAADAPNDPPTCHLAKHTVTLAAGGLRWEIGGTRALVLANGMGANCGITVGGLKDVRGWQAPDKIVATRMLADTTDAKAIEITMTVSGRKSRRTIPGVRFVLAAEARRGEPALRLRSAVRNTGDKPIHCYTTWSSFGAGTWCSRPAEPPLQADRYVRFAKSAWTYMHPAPQGGKGLVLVADLPQSTSPYAWNIYSEPRTGKLAPGEERKIDFALSIVPAAWREDPAARGAFLRAHVYASRSWGLAASQSVELRADGQPVAGAAARATLRAEPTKALEADAAWVLDERGALVPAAKAEARGTTIAVRTPLSLRTDQYLQLVARFALKAGDGAAVPLAETVDVQPTPSLTIRTADEPATWHGRSGRAALAVRNHLDRQAASRLTLEPPQGYHAAKPPTLQLAAGEERRVVLTLTAPKDAPPPADARAVLHLVPRATAGEQELTLRFAPAVACPRLPAAAVIDGKLDDPAWTHAAATSPFVLAGSAAAPREPTVALVGHDGSHLFVGFRCTESQMKRLVAKAPRRPGVSNTTVHSDDSVEVFLSPRRGRGYVQLAANSMGAQKASKPVTWQVAAATGKRGWTVEMAIDLSSLGGAPKPGDTWAVNFCRMQQRLREASSWSPVERSFHQAERFGTLTFGR